MVAIPRPPRPPRAADLSPERRATVLSLLGDERFVTADLTPGARLMYAVSALVCDDTGYATQADFEAGLADPSTVQAARVLLREAGH